MTRLKMRSTSVLVLGFTFALISIAPVAAAGPTSAAASGASVAASKKPCPSDIANHWSCVTLTMPVDHFHNTGKTIDVTFALKRHTGAGPAKGVWVTITGGPGTAGIYSAVDYTSTFAPSIRRDYDLVFMDQRGSGMSGGFTCPNSALDYYSDQSEGNAGVKNAAHTFVNDCLSESGVDQGMLPYYGTIQAVEDLEAFRLWIGVDKLSLYGESYGTQYVQSYAAAHPNNVKVLFLDGSVDLKTNGPEYYVEGTQAFDQVLRATLFDCTTQSECSRDVQGGNEMTAYANLSAQLDHAPISYTFTYGDGHQEQRVFTSTDLEIAAADTMYSQSDRRLLQRAMAAASHGNIWWLARLAYGELVQYPDTLKPILDPSWSDALYYAVECMDYDYFPNAGSPDQRANAYLEYGHNHGVQKYLLPSDYTGDLPCVYWPTHGGPNSRPTPAQDAPYPLVVLGSTTDPATPFGNAERIVARRGANPYGTWLIYIPGGAHVIYGRGDACPDDLVTKILVKGLFPAQHTVACPGDLVRDYVRNPDAAQIVENGRVDLLTAYDNELNYGVDYWYWDYATNLKMGCAFGGSIKYVPTNVGASVTLKNCAFVDGSSATGTGVIDDSAGSFKLDVTFTGDWQGTATYRRAPSGSQTLNGSLGYSAPD